MATLVGCIAKTIKTTLVALAAFCSMTCYAQQLTGKLVNLNGNKFTVISSDDGVSFVKDTITTINGKFTLNLKIKKTQYITLDFDDFSWSNIFISPKQILEINADCSNWEAFTNTQKYKGTAAAYNNHSAWLQKTMAAKKQQIDMKTYHLKKDDFVKSVDHYYKVTDSLTKIYQQKLTLSERNSALWKNYLVIDSIENAYTRLSFFRSYADAVIKGYGAKSAFAQQYIEPNLTITEDANYITAPAYRNFWISYLPFKYDVTAFKADTSKTFTHERYKYFAEIPKITASQLNSSLTKIISFYYLQHLADEYKKATAEQLLILDQFSSFIYAKIDDQVVSSPYLKRVNEAKNYRLQSLPGEPSFDFTLVDTAGKQYTLTDFKGKLVYIDVWASWCGPCIAEMPSLKALRAQYQKNDNVIFISVSIDDNYKKWVEKGLTVHKPEGLQLWAKNGFDSSFAKDYKITTIPQFMLIDGQGLIVDLNAPRPSDIKKISLLINETLTK
ncbi:AhpC/TSA family protein [Pedobacter frigiditerrae]|uniref:AhpC/TSA family protein n=1 Tax=Pedobacter frigiditerrae TaxID=2530452 RepID=A0A4R0MRU8_9SPHI|nr:TlpA disulfide reductase family protein [Pedobacter frigiditerrae]TCC89337.1 AhpC/TSA family protein [Pedobacter frigiditerrae]